MPAAAPGAGPVHDIEMLVLAAWRVAQRASSA
ncbi:hypothetical protein J2W33_001319 [Variovorax boronicumulans]|nr:hypothetical protein [Variovorax boronicumulans]